MKKEVKIGIFAVVILCCSWAGIRFLSGIDIFGRNVDYYAQYDQINGINTASPIMIQGVKVGKVTDIILEPESSNKVTLKLSIKRRYKIPRGSEVTIYSPGLMSSMAIGMEMGSGVDYLQSGDTIAARNEADLMSVATEKLMAISDQISTVGEQLTQTLTSVNSILESSEGNINSTFENLNSISTDLSTLLDSQRSNMEGVVEGFAALSTTLGDNSESIESIIGNLNSLASELSSAQLGDNLSSTLVELNSALAKLNSNEGSAGKLLGDEQLYENLAAVSGSLNALIVDMQSNPKRYVHFSLFGVKEKSEE